MPKVRPEIVHGLREGKGLSQNELASKAGIDPKTLNRMLKGSDCNINTISYVAGALGVVTSEILDDGASDSPFAAAADNKLRISYGEHFDILLTIDCAYVLFSNSEKLAPILRQIEEVSGVRNGLEIKDVREGSVKLTVSASEQDALRLVEAFTQHKLDDIKVTKLTIPEKIIPLLLTGVLAIAPTALTFPILPAAALIYLFRRLRNAGIHAKATPDEKIVLSINETERDSTDIGRVLGPISPSLIHSIVKFITPQSWLPTFPFTAILKLSPNLPDQETSLDLTAQLQDHLTACPTLLDKVLYVEEKERLEVELENVEAFREVLETVMTHYFEKPVSITVGYKTSSATERFRTKFETTITTSLDKKDLEADAKAIRSFFSAIQ